MKRLLYFPLFTLLLTFIFLACSREDSDIRPNDDLTGVSTNKLETDNNYSITNLDITGNMVSFDIQLTDPTMPQGLGLSHLGLGFNYCPGSDMITEITNPKICLKSNPAICINPAPVVETSPGEGTGCMVSGITTYFKLDAINLDLGNNIYTVSFNITEGVLLNGFFAWVKAGNTCASVDFEIICETQQQNCVYSQGRFFASPHPWCVPGINVAGHTYTEAEARAIFRSSNKGGIKDSKAAYLQYAAILLSVECYDFEVTPQVQAHMTVIENYLASLGKLSPANLPTGNRAAKNAAGALGDWIDANHCDDNDE